MRMCIPARLNFVEMVQSKWTDERVTGKRDSGSKTRVVMDLSDQNFRKTFAFEGKEGKEGK